MIKIIVLCISLFIGLSTNAQVVVGSKPFTESIILAEVIAQLLEKKYNVEVKRKFGLGGTKIVYEALLQDHVHIYPEYTGTGYLMILKMDGERDPEKVFDIVHREFLKKGIKWFPPVGLNNTYALTVRDNDERFKEITKISQLKEIVRDKKIASGYEFMERKDGFHKFTKKYDLQFKVENRVIMNPGLMYDALHSKEVDFLVAYSTDGRINAYNLRMLEDDLNFFPPYYASYMVKESILESNPKLTTALEATKGLVSDKEILILNDKVDRLKLDVEQVVSEFLANKGLIEGSSDIVVKKKTFFNFLLSKKMYLLKLLKEHVILSFSALFIALFISIPIGITLVRNEKLGRYIFPVINLIQTIPSLALLGFLIPVVGIGVVPAILVLFLYSLLPLIQNIYTGIKNVDEKYVEVAKGIGLTSWQILFKVEIPMALPVIIAGFRTAAVIVIGTATVAAFIGAGGFGDPIFRGISTVNKDLILLGAVPVALFAIIVDKGLAKLEEILVSPGIR